MAYYLEMRDESGCFERTEMGGNEIDGPPSSKSIREECKEWVSDGEWGNNGADVEVMWNLTDEDGDEIDSGSESIYVEPNHDELIRLAGGDVDCEHEWSSENEGGCSQNPGVWSLGGTKLQFNSTCEKCGLHRKEIHVGSQHNPGEHDKVEYFQDEKD